MFFQQTHNARSAAEEADEGNMGGYYLDPPPWFISGTKRLSTASALSARSRRSGDHISVPSPTASLECPPPSRQASVASQGAVPRLYSRQSSAVRSSGSLAAPRKGFAARRPTGHPLWRRAKSILSSSFGLFLLIQSYLCFGAFCFMWLEAEKESEQRTDMNTERLNIAKKLVNCSSNVSCHYDALLYWESKLFKIPQIYLEISEGQIWSWIYSYYCSFTIISTIGYGNVTPLSVFGRLYAVAYAVVGIPLMLLFITDIGNKFARWTKVAIIKFRKFRYKLCGRYHESRQKGEATSKKSLEGGTDRRTDDQAEGGGNGAREDEEDAPRKEDTFGGWNIPEVHINIAMSALDEEGCLVETKDIGGAVAAEARWQGHSQDHLDYKDAGLHAPRDNSDYGGSSTGEEACITDTGETGRGPVSSVTVEVETPGESATESTFNRNTAAFVRPIGADERVELSPRWRLDEITEDGDIAEDGYPSDKEIVCPQEQEDGTIKHDLTEQTAQMAKKPDSVEVSDEICKNEPGDVLHTSLLRRATDFGLRTCSKCGQSMQNVPNVRFTDNSDEWSEHTNSDVDKRRNSELSIASKAEYLRVKETLVNDSLSMDIKTTSPLYESLLRTEHETPQFLSTYFRHDSIVDEQCARELQKGPTKKYSSLKGIKELQSYQRDPESSGYQPAVKGTRNRRTSLPIVSFQTKPKPNGRLPNRHSVRSHEGDDDDDAIHPTPTDEETDADRDKAATDSGVASSTSNSTECSPKRRLDFVRHEFPDSSDENENPSGNDAVSEDDVMDSEEEKNLEKLRKLRLGAGRPSTAGREFMRVSEADIAMLSIPVWLALLLLLIYLFIGAGCFSAMQGWSFIDGFYYCFISLSTIGFGDLVFLPQNIHVGLLFSFLYSFFGLCFTSMCMSLSSMELTLLSRKIASKFGVYRGRIRSLRTKRWASRRRRTIREPSPDKPR